jgi:hypothetical protein
MNTFLRPIALVALMSVCGVRFVSGFAQADTLREREPLRSSLSAARVYVAKGSATFDQVEPAPNLIVGSVLQALIVEMLARSPTFRRQCARLAAATNLTVLVRSDLPIGTRAGALTSIQMKRHGKIEAVVRVGLSHRTAELIAHEIEHIVEQLDGIDLRTKSRQPASGVRHVLDLDAYETTRAIATGLRVARELAGNEP